MSPGMADTASGASPTVWAHSSPLTVAAKPKPRILASPLGGARYGERSDQRRVMCAAGIGVEAGAAEAPSDAKKPTMRQSRPVVSTLPTRTGGSVPRPSRQLKRILRTPRAAILRGLPSKCQSDIVRVGLSFEDSRWLRRAYRWRVVNAARVRPRELKR